MQKDAHFYMTYVIARLIGINAQTAKIIAWADQYTDDMTRDDMAMYGIQTQCDLLENWKEREVQYTVLVPFHFLPGDDPKYPWNTTADCKMARLLIRAALDEKNPYALGIALHSLQDTFTHQGFSGWSEDSNRCYPWYYLQSALPNVGHTEMQTMPDIIHATWTDPRTNRHIINAIRAFLAAEATHDVLADYHFDYDYYCEKAAGPMDKTWDEIKVDISNTFKLGYDERKVALKKLVPTSIEYNRSKTRGWLGKHKEPFICAARKQLARVMEQCVNKTVE